MLAKEAASLGWILMFLAAKQIGWVLIKVTREVAAWEKESCRGVSSFHRFSASEIIQNKHTCVLSAPYRLQGWVLVSKIYCVTFCITLAWNAPRAGLSALHNNLTGSRGKWSSFHFTGEKQDKWRY